VHCPAPFRLAWPHVLPWLSATVPQPSGATDTTTYAAVEAAARAVDVAGPRLGGKSSTQGPAA